MPAYAVDHTEFLAVLLSPNDLFTLFLEGKTFFMKGIFNFESPLVQKLTLVADLILINLLWLICSIPVITVGAATAAMHAVIFQQITETNSAVVAPFFKAFIKNFKQSTLLWLPVLIACLTLVFDGSYLIAAGSGEFHLLWTAFFVVLLLVGVVVAYGFPQIARYVNSLRTIITNSFFLFLMHFFPSLFVVLLNGLPWALLFFFPNIFMSTSIFWILMGMSLITYINDRILLGIFKKHQNLDQ